MFDRGSADQAFTKVDSKRLYDLLFMPDTEAVVQVVSRFVDERSAGETFSQWLERSGGAKAVGTTLGDLDAFPTPDEAPEFYVDFAETGPYEAVVGDSECAT